MISTLRYAPPACRPHRVACPPARGGRWTCRPPYATRFVPSLPTSPPCALPCAPTSFEEQPMKASTVDPAKKPARRARGANGNGIETAVRAADAGDGSGDRVALLAALQAVVGRRLLRAPARRLDRARRQDRGRFNDIVAANQQMCRELERVGQVVGSEGKTRQRAQFPRSDRRLGRDGGLGQHPDRRPAAAHHRGHPGGDRGRPGRPAADRAPRRRRPSAGGRVPALGHHRQHDDRAAGRVHLRGDARGARGRHRRQARRPGAGAGGQRRVEGPDRERQPRWPAT